MNVDYEYRISPTCDLIIQVRPTRESAGEPQMWSVYMVRRTADDAREVLRLLNAPAQAVGDVVRE